MKRIAKVFAAGWRFLFDPPRHTYLNGKRVDEATAARINRAMDESFADIGKSMDRTFARMNAAVRGDNGKH